MEELPGNEEAGLREPKVSRKRIHARLTKLFSSDREKALRLVFAKFEKYRFDNGFYPLLTSCEDFQQENLDLTEVTSRYLAYWLYGPVCGLDRNYDQNLPTDDLELKFMARIFVKLMHEKKYDYYLGYQWETPYPDVNLILKLIKDIVKPSRHLEQDRNCGRKFTREQFLKILVRHAKFNFERVTLHLYKSSPFSTNFNLATIFEQRLENVRIPMTYPYVQDPLEEFITKNSKPWSLAFREQYMQVPGFKQDARHVFLLSKRFPRWFPKDLVNYVYLPMLYSLNRQEYLAKYQTYTELKAISRSNDPETWEVLLRKVFEKKVIPWMDIVRDEVEYRANRIQIPKETLLNEQLLGLEVGFQITSRFTDDYSRIALRQYYEDQHFSLAQVQRFLSSRQVVYDESLNLKQLLNLVVQDAFVQGVSGSHFDLSTEAD